MGKTPALGDSTNKALLLRVRDWQDDAAWSEFVAHYDRYFRAWCFRSGLSPDMTDELCERLWVGLMGRMRRFEYDPGRRFRGWLKTYFRRTRSNLFRGRSGAGPALLSDADLERAALVLARRSGCEDEPGDDAPASRRLALHREALAIQASVRARVAPESWDAFVLIALYGWSMSDAGRFLKKKPTAVFQAHQRVRQMLAERGAQSLGAVPSAPRPS